MNFSPLSFSPVGEMQVTLYVEGLSMSWCISPSPTGEARWGLMSVFFSPITTNYSAKKLQPPLVLPRRGDAGYLAQLFPLWADTI